MADMLTELDRRLQAMNPRSGGTAHLAPVRPSVASPACQESPSRASSLAPMSCATSEPRRGIVVTVALSEPANLPQLDWAATLASIIRLATQDTSVIVIDTWEVSK